MTLRQGVYVLFGAALSFLVLNKIFRQSPVLAVALIAIILSLACFLAFYKVGDTDLHIDRYLVRLWLFQSRTHGYTYSRSRREVET